MKILVLNAGSSSLKFSVYDKSNFKLYISGSFERIGLEKSVEKYKINKKKYFLETNIKNYKIACLKILTILKENNIINNEFEIEYIGHRVVHGGIYFSNPVFIDNDVKTKIEQCIELAPLHNPVNLDCINIAEEVFTKSKQIAVFDTAFHQTIPKINYLYAISKKYYEKYKIRKYGFHGISHEYVYNRMLEITGEKPDKVISCHIGNGASLSAIKNGKCINTSMGFTPVDGLVMGTRVGDIDPGVILFLQEKENLSPKETSDLINKHSGVLGLTGTVADLKDLEDGIENGNHDYELALDIYVSRIVRFIGAYIADLGGVDTIIFTAGVLENSSNIRKKIAEKLFFAGVDLDEFQNLFRGEEKTISTKHSKVRLIVIPTNEELMIAKEVFKIS